jgi:glycosyltransferase involved in cell wall biosynthesis
MRSNGYHFRVNSTEDETSAPRDRGSGPIDVSVIIPVYNDLDGLTSCIAALVSQKMTATAFEVIVVDNGPLDGAHARLTAAETLLSSLPNAKALHEPRPGSYAARNLGIESATGRVFAFTDSDCRPEPTWLATGLAFLDEHPDVAAVGGPVELFPMIPEAPTGAELYDLIHGFQVENYITTAFFGVTANLFVRRETLDEIGPFDASLRSSGDKEWGNRLHRHGGVLRFVRDAAVKHPARRTVDELRIKAKRVVSGDMKLRRRQGWSRLNWLRYTLQPLRPPLRTIWRARNDSRIHSRSELLRYGAVFILVRWMTSYYRLIALRNWPTA